MLEYAYDEVRDVEARLNTQSTREDALRMLRGLGLSDFGQLFLRMPDPAFPQLSRLLPQMASDEVQKNWTGTAGDKLLVQSLDFVRSVAYNFNDITGRTLHNQTILDFGCGYGRLARLMYHFTPEKLYYGVDPWDESIRLCNEAGLKTNFSVSEYLPTTLPVNDQSFDLIFAFSVFTHLSERATLVAIRTLAEHLKSDGVLAITIRPVEYWHVDNQAKRLDVVKAQIERHHQEGFAYLPHVREAVDGDITYGDTSMTLDWLKEHAPHLKVVRTDRSLNDPYQRYVFMQRA